ncbi:MAG TPA: hypothetical protein VII94_05395, partial [Candidatus Saccharimonadales bacterium]
LENYYKKYFKNRQIIVNFASQYQSAFTSRENTVTNDDAKLSSLKSQIDSLNATLATELNEIKTQQANLNTLKANGDYSGYNNDVVTIMTLLTSIILSSQPFKT